MYTGLSNWDLPQQLQTRVDRGSNNDAMRNDDVVCLIKKFICQPELGQEPLLVMTHRQAAAIPNLPTEKHPAREVAADAKEKWNKLASTVEDYYGESYRPAAEYLRNLVRGYFHENTDLEDLPWLLVNGVRFQGEPVFNLHKSVLDALAPSQPLRAVWARRQ